MVNPKLRIAIIHPAIHGPGGAEYSVLFGAEELQKAGHEVTLIFGRYDQRFCQTDVPVRDLRNSWPKWIRSKWIDELGFKLKFAQEISNMDVVICHNFPAPIWVGGALRRNASGRKPLLVWYCHEPRRDMYPQVTEAHILGIEQFSPPELYSDNRVFFKLKERLEKRAESPKIRRNRKKENRALKNFDLILCNSQYTSSLVRQIYSLPTEVSYPPPPLPEKILAPRAITEADSAVKTVGLVATFPERKNLANSLRALVWAKNKNPKLKVVVATPSPEKFADWCRDHVADLTTGLAEFEITNTARREDLMSFFARVQLLVYVPVDEPLGLLPTEAARFGVPSLLSDHGGPAEVAEMGFGRTVNPFDFRAIGKAIVGWSENGWPEIQIGELANLVSKKFPRDLIVRDIEKAYRQFRA